MRENTENRELRRLKRRDLLEMLLVQCEETERLQKENDQIKEQMSVIMESYERLKKKLDVKDERLNQKDAKIAELKLEIEEMRMSREPEHNEMDSAAEAIRELNGVIEEVRKAVEHYMVNTKRNPFEAGRASAPRRKPGADGTGQVVPMYGQAGRSVAIGEK